MTDSAAGATEAATPTTPSNKPYDAMTKRKSLDKTVRIPIEIVPAEKLKKPDWIRMRAAIGSSRFYETKDILCANDLVAMCEGVSCPNIGECFGKGTAMFMIIGDRCTHCCPSCDVGHGRPDPLDVNEPENLTKTITELKLNYIIITSVDHDDLRNGGVQHYVNYTSRMRALSPATRIEVLMPDFRGRLRKALGILRECPPDVMNHNLETVLRLYKQARPGADYVYSLKLLKDLKARSPNVPTKFDLMVGLGETDGEVLEVMHGMYKYDTDILVINQCLAPSDHHLPVLHYMHPGTFKTFEGKMCKMDFTHAAVGTMVRGSYHADQ